MVDILVVGATGYSGRLIARYLAAHRERHSFSLAIAGRSDAKLQSLLAALDSSSSPTIDTYLVDTTDSASVDDLLRAATPRVVIAAVGPFALYGLPLARACARAGIDYIDITGEPAFVHSLINEADLQASKTGAILIPCSGFDVVPFDVLAYLSARTLTQNLPAGLSHSADAGVLESHTMWSIKGGSISGGSLATILNMLEGATAPAMRDPNYADLLSPVPAPRPARQLAYTFPAACGIREWGAFTVFGPMNLSIVQRTRGLFTLYGLKNDKSQDGDGEGDVVPVYSKRYAYSDAGRAASRVHALLVGFSVVAGFIALALFPPLRWLARRIGPKQGEGLPDEEIQKGNFRGRNISVSTALPGRDRPLVVESTMAAKGDPYALTGVFAAESALTLLGPREALPALARGGGVLTPMSGLGTALIRRLSASGVCEFESGVME